jgi:hypothetical protein
VGSGGLRMHAGRSQDHHEVRLGLFVGAGVEKGGGGRRYLEAWPDWKKYVWVVAGYCCRVDATSSSVRCVSAFVGVRIIGEHGGVCTYMLPHTCTCLSTPGPRLLPPPLPELAPRLQSHAPPCAHTCCLTPAPAAVHQWVQVRRVLLTCI